MPYHLTFPQALDWMRDSQPLMLDNYAAIFHFMGEDHVQFNNGANSGKHNQLTFPLVGTDPVNQAMWILFNRMGTIPGDMSPRVFAKTPTNTVQGFSDRSLEANQSVVNFIQLPSGIILKWVQLAEITNQTNPHIVTWSHYVDPKPFTTQYWAAVVPYELRPDLTRDQVIFYVTDVSNPLQVSYTSFVRSEFNTTQPRLPLRLLFAIGV